MRKIMSREELPELPKMPGEWVWRNYGSYGDPVGWYAAIDACEVGSIHGVLDVEFRHAQSQESIPLEVIALVLKANGVTL